MKFSVTFRMKWKIPHRKCIKVFNFFNLNNNFFCRSHKFFWLVLSAKNLPENWKISKLDQWDDKNEQNTPEIIIKENVTLLIVF